MKLWRTLACLLTLCLCLCGCGKGGRVGILQGPYSDSLYLQAAEAAARDLPARGVPCTVYTSTGDAAGDMAMLKKAGFTWVLCTDGVLSQQLAPLAAQDEKMQLILCDADGENAVCLQDARFESLYLLGVAAATASQLGRIGYVANADGIDPLTRARINAFALGVQKVAPQAVVQLGADEQALLQRCDLVVCGGSLVQGNVLRDRSGAQVARAACDVTGLLQRLAEGKLGDTCYAGLKSGVATVVCSDDPAWKKVADAVNDEVEYIGRQSADWRVFTGPIYDANRALQVAAGEIMPYDAVLQMTCFMPNVLAENAQ